jgi:hypothetical protein
MRMLTLCAQSVVWRKMVFAHIHRLRKGWTDRMLSGNENQDPHGRHHSHSLQVQSCITARTAAEIRPSHHTHRAECWCSPQNTCPPCKPSAAAPLAQQRLRLCNRGEVRGRALPAGRRRRRRRACASSAWAPSVGTPSLPTARVPLLHLHVVFALAARLRHVPHARVLP